MGGGIRLLWDARHEILDGYGLDEMAAFAHGQTLVPWRNRLAGRRYRFGNEEYRLALTEPGQGNAIHGLGRWVPWRVVAEEPSRAMLAPSLYPQAGYPFALEVENEYVLAPDGLTVRTTVTNAGRAPAPYGVGFHPYLTVGTPQIDDARLRIPAAVRLETDDRGIPTGRRIDLDGDELDFRTARRIGGTTLDTAFGDLLRTGEDVRILSPGEWFASAWGIQPRMTA